MESPVVVDKPPEYHGNDRGFPFDEEEGAGAWSELAARHPDIAARLRQRPATWARKRRPSSQDASDEFGDSFSDFDRFPFDDIPPEFREHFPTHWNSRFNSREEQPQQSQTPQPASQQTTATQTEQDAGPSEHEQQTHLPQYGLRNTVDLGQKSPADPSLVDADDRNQRSMSAPPDNCAQNQNSKMSGQNHHDQHSPQQGEQQSNVRHIPIFVEGRDEPVINRSVDHGTHFGETKQNYAPPPPQPHTDREQYFTDDGPVGFHHPPNFSRAFGTPFNKGYRQGPQPFVQQKVYPQTAFARGTSPQRSQSPKPQPHPEEHFKKVPVHHEHAATPKTEPPSRAQTRQPPQQPPPSQQSQHAPQQPQREQTPPPKPQQVPVNDPITQILSIQTDVLNLMTEVENFTGTKKDKRYLFLDEMLTRNLIKLDTIETEGKENIRLARKEAIRCIQKCIAVLEAKADSNNASRIQAQAQDVEMKENSDSNQEATKPVTENGEVDMKEITKEEEKGKIESAEAQQVPQTTPVLVDAKAEAKPQETNIETKPPQEVKIEAKPQEAKIEAQSKDTNVEIKPNEANVETKPQEKIDTKPQASAEVAPPEHKENTQTQAANTRTDKASEQTENNVQNETLGQSTPKKNTKVVKKRNKSKDNKKEEPKASDKQENNEDDSNKEQKPVEQKDKAEVMQVDDKGDKAEPQLMEIDSATSQ